MRELGLNPSSVESFLMQDCAHGVTETMSGCSLIVTNPFNNHIDAGFAHWFINIVSTCKDKLVSTGQLL
jgi:hypothetical protein